MCRASRSSAALTSQKPSLNYGWWTLLEPHLTDSSRKDAKDVREQARKDLEDENKVLPAKIRQIRSGQ
jgi:hypothetical protein